jgi:hypothetical protein
MDIDKAGSECQSLPIHQNPGPILEGRPDGPNAVAAQCHIQNLSGGSCAVDDAGIAD